MHSKKKVNFVHEKHSQRMQGAHYNNNSDPSTNYIPAGQDFEIITARNENRASMAD